MQEAGIRLSTEMFFESVPDEYVDVSLDKWHFDEDARVIPIIIQRNYLNLYNFGFAQSRSLPKLSEGLMSLVQMDVMMRGNRRVEQYKGNINFEYDLVDIVRQSNADKGNALLDEISQSYDRKDKENFRKQTQQFLELILSQDSLLSTRKEFSVSSWLTAARSLGNTDAEKKLYEWNASALITVWGDSIASNQGGLHDYSHREWSGLLKDLYYLRWKTFFEQKQQELEGKASGEVIKFYGMEKAWAEKVHEY